MAKVLLAILLLLAPYAAFAHVNVIYTNNPPYQEQITSTVNNVENFFKNNYGLELTDTVCLYVVNGSVNYRNKLKDVGIENYQYLARMSHGISKGKNIVVDASGTLPKVKHVIAHELTHQYQFQTKGVNSIDNMILFEGTAEYVGYLFGEGIPLWIKDRGISKTMSYHDWSRMVYIQGSEKFFEQALYEVMANLKTTGKLII